MIRIDWLLNVIEQRSRSWTGFGVNRMSHYCDVIMGAMTSQITSLTIVYSIVYSGADKIKLQSSASLAFVWEIHRLPVNSPHKWPVTQKMFQFDVIMLVADTRDNLLWAVARSSLKLWVLIWSQALWAVFVQVYKTYLAHYAPCNHIFAFHLFSEFTVPSFEWMMIMMARF